ncbi:MAG: sigma 54-interacting transcriptional regulator [Megasphaera sp.]|jgi:PAS domain S-box-containing protein|nr:sigma 54-interacting transcriptional regulator [Megasphaera sp.]MCH4188120.1 sigma 54-interacting transcriptional regulator [Megasphaera sp.]MCH4217958.1 sigma 54-interacting transcriptional regulator [Megasphaera sp.]
MTYRQIFSTVREAAERLGAIIEHSFDGIYITDSHANTILINHAYEDITGLRKKDVIGKNMSSLVQNKIISTSGSLRVIQTKKPVTLQQQFKTGKEALITSSPIFDEEGRLVMVVTNVRDLTEIYSLKEAIQKKDDDLERFRLKLEHLSAPLNEEEIIFNDDTSLGALLLANRVAPMDTTVLLLGETGVGKEVMARYIYQHSLRSKNSFIKVNCGAIPESLIESELFGYESGAFTGASRSGKIGLFELANKGTLFLDEIGELPKDMQVKLLRALQEQEIMRVGGTKPIKIDIRIIAATNRSLKDMVKSGQFREDLYYRLTVFPVSIPPLRSRKKDITPLAISFLTKLNQKYNFNKYFTDISIQLLNEYKWPGNIRELKNIVERAIIISSGNEITPEDLHLFQQTKPIIIVKEKPEEPRPVPAIPAELPDDLNQALASIEYDYLVRAYNQYGNVRDAAQAIGITASTFVRKRKKYEDTKRN